MSAKKSSKVPAKKLMKHDDTAEDKALIKKMVKGECLTGKSKKPGKK